MIITITLILAALVALNFLLLIFSCNKTDKQVIDNRMPRAIHKINKSPKVISSQLKSPELAPTGS